MWAAEFGQTVVVDVLLKHHARMDLQDKVSVRSKSIAVSR